MFKNFKNIHYKELLLYGFYGSYIVLTLIASVVDFFIDNRVDALIDFMASLVAIIAFSLYLKYKNHEIASIAFMWMAALVVFTFMINNEFDISIIFSLLVPLIAFLLFSRKRIIINVIIYLFLLVVIFAYGYMMFDTHPLLYESKPMSAYIIALLFILSFGIFYHIAIEQSYKELEEANRQKTFLLKEIHHRVKNNLNIIASILGIQKFESDSKEVHTLIDQNRLRLESMAMAHEILYSYESLEKIDFKLYMEKLTKHILKIESHKSRVDIILNILPISLNIEIMIQFGLMVNELMTNSIKYAFSNQGGDIEITFQKVNKGYLFVYSDNGKGLNHTNHKNGFGHSLIEMIIEQLNGELTIINQDGLRYEILLKGLGNENINS